MSVERLRAEAQLNALKGDGWQNIATLEMDGDGTRSGVDRQCT